MLHKCIIVSMLIAGIRLAGMVKTLNKDVTSSFILQNNLYEPIIVELFNIVTEHFESKILPAHRKVMMRKISPSVIISVMLATAESAEPENDQKELIITSRLANYVKIIHILRKRSSPSGLTCYCTNTDLATLRKLLLEKQCKFVKEAQGTCLDDEKEADSPVNT